jgi:hypothetical protein
MSSDSDNDSEFEENICVTKKIRKGGPPKKKDTFVNERKNIIQQLDDMLNMTEKNRLLCTNDISNKTKNKIINMIPEIKKFFCVTRWTFFKSGEDETISNCLSLIKSIYKDEGYDIETISTTKTKNDVRITYTVLKIYK